MMAQGGENNFPIKVEEPDDNDAAADGIDDTDSSELVSWAEQEKVISWLEKKAMFKEFESHCPEWSTKMTVGKLTEVLEDIGCHDILNMLKENRMRRMQHTRPLDGPASQLLHGDHTAPCDSPPNPNPNPQPSEGDEEKHIWKGSPATATPSPFAAGVSEVENGQKCLTRGAASQQPNNQPATVCTVSQYTAPKCTPFLVSSSLFASMSGEPRAEGPNQVDNAPGQLGRALEKDQVTSVSEDTNSKSESHEAVGGAPDAGERLDKAGHSQGAESPKKSSGVNIKHREATEAELNRLHDEGNHLRHREATEAELNELHDEGNHLRMQELQRRRSLVIMMLMMMALVILHREATEAELNRLRDERNHLRHREATEAELNGLHDERNHLRHREATEAELNRLRDEVNNLTERYNLQQSMLAISGQRVRDFRQRWDHLQDSLNGLADRLGGAHQMLIQFMAAMNWPLAEINPQARFVLFGRDRPPEQVCVGLVVLELLVVFLSIALFFVYRFMMHRENAN